MWLLLLISVCLGFNFNLKKRRDNNIAQVKTIIKNDTIQIVMGYFQSGNSILNEHNYTYDDSSNDIRGTVTIDEREYYLNVVTVQVIFQIQKFSMLMVQRLFYYLIS